jgi:hypothetical protein
MLAAYSNGLFRSRLEELCKQSAADERQRLAQLFEDEAKAVPEGAEDPQKGQSVYNWIMWACRKIRES